MKRTPTNFGPYESEYRARVSRSRRLALVAMRLLLVSALVVLAGLFLFPMGAHARRCGLDTPADAKAQPPCIWSI